MKVYLKENPSFYCYLFWHCYHPTPSRNKQYCSLLLGVHPRDLTCFNAFGNVQGLHCTLCQTLLTDPLSASGVENPL